MRIVSLGVSNLRAIEAFEIKDLSDFILIAGPNGCGKTTVLDAVRLVKSVYVADEWKKWFSEFGVNVDRPTNWLTLFRNPRQPISIKAVLLLSDEEKAFLLAHAFDIAQGIVMPSFVERRGATTVTGDPVVIPPTLTESQLDELKRDAQALATDVQDSLRAQNEFVAQVTLREGPEIEVTPSPVATVAFTCFCPDELGEVEFHTSRRFYGRESTVENIRLRVASRTEERRSRFLYDLENKYKNIKSQLGEEYVASVLRGTDPDQGPLQRSVKELFRTFFPGKEFLVVTLAGDNSLQFTVQLSTGERHDIDELSSGEKEIVYGYLWLRTGTPRNSVILVDEPELHLNPALVQGLAGFYQQHLATALDAQVWIVTHSDAILRQAVRAPNMAVFHMARPFGDGSDQARRIDSQDAVEAAVLDLVGDLAAYRPYARIVLVEGHRDTRFDVDMIRRLFPDIAERANIIPVGNRSMTHGVRVRLVEVLEAAGLTGRAVSISDGDLGLTSVHAAAKDGHFTWPVYEIENFLLEPVVIRAAVSALTRRDPFGTDHAVIEALRSEAAPLVDQLALDEVQYALNQEFVTAVSIGASRKNPVPDLVASADASQRRVAAVEVSQTRVETLVRAAAANNRATLNSDEFLIKFPGDRLLRALAGHLGLNADHFRNACLDQAQRLGLRPARMEEILRAALA